MNIWNKINPTINNYQSRSDFEIEPNNNIETINELKTEIRLTENNTRH